MKYSLEWNRCIDIVLMLYMFYAKICIIYIFNFENIYIFNFEILKFKMSMAV